MKMIEGSRELFQVFGVPMRVTANSWQFFPPKFVIGLIVSFLALQAEPIEMRIVWGLVYGLLLISSLFLHIMGHIIASKRVQPPMTHLLMTPILIETRYDNDPADLPPRVHLTRTFGGPIMTFALGILGLLLYQLFPHHAVLYFAGANLVLLLVVLLPFPTVDGLVIWREIGRMLRKA
jgi:Zn-dependent protease